MFVDTLYRGMPVITTIIATVIVVFIVAIFLYCYYCRT